MGLNTTAKDTDTVAWISCDDCKAEATRTQSQDRNRAKKRAERLAADQGFVWYDGGKTWVCPVCRIRRLPDKLKAECPKLCEQYGIPVPALKPELPLRRVVKRRRASTPPVPPATHDQPSAASGEPAQ